MKKKMDDADEPIGKLIRIKNFLPPPDKLVFPEKPVKVTILLSPVSVKFFKSRAKRYHTKYQKMIRSLLDSYASHYDRKG